MFFEFKTPKVTQYYQAFIALTSGPGPAIAGLMKQYSALFGIMFLSACGKMPLVLDNCECGYYVTSEQKAMVWPGGSQVQFQFEHEFPENGAQAVEIAGSEFNDSISNLQIKYSDTTVPQLGSRDPNDLAHDGINGIYWLDGEWPWGEEESHTAAMTVVSFGMDSIVEADIYFRAELFEEKNQERSQYYFGAKSLLSTPLMMSDDSFDSRWIYLLATHELGHAIGLVHSSTQEAIMYPVVGSTQAKRSEPLYQSDIEVLSKIYQMK